MLFRYRYGGHGARSSSIASHSLKTTDFPRGTGITSVPIFFRHSTVEYARSVCFPFRGTRHKVLWYGEIGSLLFVKVIPDEVPLPLSDDSGIDSVRVA